MTDNNQPTESIDATIELLHDMHLFFNQHKFIFRGVNGGEYIDREGFEKAVAYIQGQLYAKEKEIADLKAYIRDLQFLINNPDNE